MALDCTDQKKLADMARNDPRPWVRLEALEKITDQKLLAELLVGWVGADQNQEENWRRNVIGMLTDQSLLIEIARTEKVKFLVYWAVKNPNLIDQVFLNEIARTHNDCRVRLVAAKKITDQEVLADIVRSDPDPDVRNAAATNPNFTDKVLLAKLKVQFADEKPAGNKLVKLEPNKTHLANAILMLPSKTVAYKDPIRIAYDGGKISWEGTLAWSSSNAEYDGQWELKVDLPPKRKVPGFFESQEMLFRGSIADIDAACIDFYDLLSQSFVEFSPGSGQITRLLTDKRYIEQSYQRAGYTVRIVIAGVATLFWDEKDDWVLRIPAGSHGEKHVPLSELYRASGSDDPDKVIYDTLAATGLIKSLKR